MHRPAQLIADDDTENTNDNNGNNDTDAFVLPSLCTTTHSVYVCLFSLLSPHLLLCSLPLPMVLIVTAPCSNLLIVQVCALQNQVPVVLIVTAAPCSSLLIVQFMLHLWHMSPSIKRVADFGTSWLRALHNKGSRGVDCHSALFELVENECKGSTHSCEEQH
jgi:hypothetical protein